MGKLNQGVALRACNASIGEVEVKGLHCGFKVSLGFRMGCRPVSARVRPCLKDKQEIKKCKGRRVKEKGGKRMGENGDNLC